jgi:hypothetical protein
MMGHFLLDQMPIEGLAETFESLAEFYEYYTERSQTVQYLLDEPATYSAKVLPVSERPAFRWARE